jgi:ADP-ribose pyrophosphatase
MESNPWETVESEVVYSNNWVEVKHNKVINPVGNDGIYGIVHFKNIAAAIIPIDAEMNTYLVGQFRYPLNEYSWEVPMGGSPLAESPIEGAKRELKEETGLVAEKWTEIAKIHTSNCVCDEVGYVYLAENISQHESVPDETEQLAIKKLPFSEVLNMVMENRITDSISQIAILKVARILGL